MANGKKHKRGSDIETKATLASPDDALLTLFGITSTGSGVAVSPAQALAVPAVAAAIRVISEACASLDRTVVQGPRGAGKVQPDHPITKLLNGDVNPWTSATELIRDLVAQALTQNAGGIGWINRVAGRSKIGEIIQWRNGVVSVEIADNGEPTFKGPDNLLDPRDVIHVRAPFDRCPLSLAAEAIGIAAVMERHAARLFKSGARPSGIVHVPKGVGEGGAKKIIAAWNAAHGGSEKSGKTAILWDGAEFKPFMLNSVDSQFLQLRVFQNLEIARAFGVPPSMIFELERMTWTNSEQLGKEFLTFHLEPWLQILEAALGRVLLTREERDQGLRIHFDRDDLSQADLEVRATAINSLIASKVLNANEARSWLGLAPRDGGNAFENPNINPERAPAIV